MVIIHHQLLAVYFQLFKCYDEHCCACSCFSFQILGDFFRNNCKKIAILLSERLVPLYNIYSDIGSISFPNLNSHWYYYLKLLGEEVILGDWDGHMHTAIYVIDITNKNLLYNPGNSIQYSIITYMQKESKRVNICICVTDSPCCTPET